jgi:hypothetical protein
MSIKKYTNIEQINLNKENVGQFIEDKDLFIIAKNQTVNATFGDNSYDVMEVSVYDINNNLLPQKSGNNVSYIKTGDIKNYMYNVTNKNGTKEVAIDAEKLLNDLGFTNGILKLNINFVRNKVGNNSELTKVWIQEISPSREEIRILPLKTKNETINKITNLEFSNLKKQYKTFSSVKENINLQISIFENSFLTKIDDYLNTQFGTDYLLYLKKDFGLKNFDDYVKKIYTDFKSAVNNYLTNKNYNINSTDFGKVGSVRFIDSEIYKTEDIEKEINLILMDCITKNIPDLKQRTIETTKIEKQFKNSPIDRTTIDNTDSFPIVSQRKIITITPDAVTFTKISGATNSIPPTTPTYVIKDTLINFYCTGFDKWGKYADGKGGNYEKLVESNSTFCAYTPPKGDGGSGGGGTPAGGGGGRPAGGTEGGRNDIDRNRDNKSFR